MAAGFAPPRGDGQAASASRSAALMRITVEMMTFSNALCRAPSSSLTAFGIDPARNLFGRCHREIVARDFRKAARLEFVLERREFGLGALHDGVGAADRIGESFVGEEGRRGRRRVHRRERRRAGREAAEGRHLRHATIAPINSPPD